MGFIPVKAATLEQMAGQMILIGFGGNAVSKQSVIAMRDLVAKGQVGGVMFLTRNAASLSAVRAMNSAFTDASNQLPPFIAVDQEGGSVERLTRDIGFQEIQSAAEIARGMSPDSARRIYTGMARSLRELGFNLNFGPVADLDINIQNPIIARYGRAFSANAGKVTQYASAFIDAHHRTGMLTALKHFPGHGSSSSDSHEGFVDITDSWQARELEPYRALIAQGQADMVMVGHLFHQKFVTETSSQPPSSLSPNWITGVLRDQLGFDGVVISDDLEMSAVREHFGFRNAIVRAVNAGTDILLFSNTNNYHGSLASEILQVLVSEARADPMFKARVEKSYARIVVLKARIGG